MEKPFLVIVMFTVGYLCFLIIEQAMARRNRRTLLHVVHVNGTRGKSTVARMIDAGLRAGGMCVMTKTTGTIPMIIGIDGTDTVLKRRGTPSIREQQRILRRAHLSGADVLVVECMAVAPEMQYISQHRILRADIGVITNVRMDHMDMMGSTLEDICQSLMNSIPKNGLLFTADARFFPEMEKRAKKLGSRAILCKPEDTDLTVDFCENTAIALAVCTALGVSREVAEEGIVKYLPDPYAFSIHRLEQDCLFINAMSCNDLMSTLDTFHRARDLAHNGESIALIVNNREDRSFRLPEMLKLICAMEPQPVSVYLLGSHQGYLHREIRKKKPELPVVCCAQVLDLPFERLSDTLFFAAGNIKGNGIDLMNWVHEHEV